MEIQNWKCETHHLMKGEVGKSEKININFKTQLPFVGMWEIGSWWLIIRTGGSIILEGLSKWYLLQRHFKLREVTSFIIWPC